MRARVLLIASVDLLLWLLVAWLILVPVDVPFRRRLWHDATIGCRRAALFFGRQALLAESRYWEEVNKA